MNVELGLLDLVRALRAFREEWGLETLAASMDLPGGEVSISVKRDGSTWIDAHGQTVRFEERAR